MKTSKAVATAAPVPFKVKGVEYRFSPLTEGEVAEFESWVQTTYIRGVKKHTADLERDERSKLLSEAFKNAATMTMTSSYVLQFAATVEGAARLVQLSIRKHHPDVTLDTVMSWMFDPEILNFAMDTYDIVNSRPFGKGRQRQPTKKRKLKLTKP